ncbi:MAG: hypothetical protein AB8B48_08025 [Pseudomonadales bacterium]
MTDSLRTVPDRMLGCWHRRYIKFGDGPQETDTEVIWLQTLSGMADMRIRKNRPDLRSYKSLSDLSLDQLTQLADADCSCGITRLDKTTEPYETASWHDGDNGFAQQLISNFPEDGWMEWKEQGRCMMEYAPSGQYEEDWRLQTGSEGAVVHLLSEDGPTTQQLFLSGRHLVLAIDRAHHPKDEKSLLDLFKQFKDDRLMLETLVSSEFSYAVQPEGTTDMTFMIERSTIPWREGEHIDLSFLNSALKASSSGQRLVDATGRSWSVISSANVNG